MILNARRLKVVMFEGFPSFGTKAFVICCVTTEDGNTPGLAVELTSSDVSLSIFYHGFCYGKFNDQPVEDAQRRAFAAVKVS